MSSISAGVSLARVLTCLWIAERLLSPIVELEQCRRGIHATLKVYVGVRGYDLPEAAQALMRLGVSLFASTRERMPLF